MTAAETSFSFARVFGETVTSGMERRGRGFLLPFENQYISEGPAVDGGASGGYGLCLTIF